MYNCVYRHQSNILRHVDTWLHLEFPNYSCFAFGCGYTIGNYWYIIDVPLNIFWLGT